MHPELNPNFAVLPLCRSGFSRDYCNYCRYCPSTRAGRPAVAVSHLPHVTLSKITLVRQPWIDTVIVAHLSLFIIPRVAIYLFCERTRERWWFTNNKIRVNIIPTSFSKALTNVKKDLESASFCCVWRVPIQLNFSFEGLILNLEKSKLIVLDSAIRGRFVL